MSINALCTEDKKVQEMPGVRGKPWVTMLQSSVSFLAGHDEVYPHLDINIIIVY